MSCPRSKDGLIVPRLFSRIDAAKDEVNEPCPLSDFFSESALVILGEPGMGKSTSFIQAAHEEANAQCLTIRQFINQKNHRDLNGKILYLDALDEQRAGRENGNDVLDNIIGRLNELDHPKFRLSCRTADWFGELDQSNLKDASSSGSVTVIRLEPLTEEQILEIVVAQELDGDTFLEQARQSGIEEWITNPQHLKMVLKVVSQGQVWPETRNKLFQRACLELAREHNERHSRASTAPSDDQLILAAGLLCALILRADLDGVTLEQANAGDGFPDLTRFPESGLPFSQAARTKLFRHPAPERATYYHRTLAEYLAARFLVHRMANGLPAERVRRLLTTKNGLVPSHLRGLHAWVATLCPEPGIALFLKIDPMGLAMFGDPASLSPSRKADVLDGISELAKENPWFRGGHWEAHPLGRLADLTLKKRFEAMLNDWKNQPPHMLFTLLDIVQHGKSLLVSRTALLDFINNHEVPTHFRARGASAFIGHCPDALADLKSVLVEHDKNAKPDDNQKFRAVLLETLYPSHLTPAELVCFLPPPPKGLIGTYDMFLVRGLVEKTPDEQFPELLCALVQNKHHLDHGYESCFALRTLVGETLTLTLEKHGDKVSDDILWDWLSVGVEEHGFPTLLDDRDNAHASQVREWLRGRPEKIKSLLLLWIKRTPVNQLETDIYLFWERMQGLETPSWFPDWCLGLAAESMDEEASSALFRIGISSLLSQPAQPPYPLERAFSFVAHFPRFEPFLEPFLYDELSDIKWKIRRINNRRYQKKELHKREMIADLSNRLDGIRDGSDLGALNVLGQVYQGWFNDVDQDASPSDRLRKETSPEIALAAEEGFERCLANPSLPTPEKIGQSSAENKEPDPIGWPILAAMDLISKNKAKIPTELEEAPYLAALAFQLAMPSSQEYPSWFMLIVESCSDLAAKALYEFWLPQLHARCQSILGLYEISRDEKWSGVASKVAIPLLSDFRNLNGKNLDYLLLAALKWGDRQELMRFVGAVMGCGKDQVAGWPQWTVLACVLEVVEWSRIEPALVESDDEAKAFFDLFVDIFFDEYRMGNAKQTDVPLKTNLLGELLAFFGKIYPPRQLPTGGVGWVTPEIKYAERVEMMINKLAAEMKLEVTTILQSLVDNDALLPWRDRLRSTLAQHRQKMADKSFFPLSWSEVFNVIQGGPPATAGDLQALVMDQILSIARELRDGNTDGYKAFWNLDSYGRTKDPIPEEDGRDRLLEKLRVLLSPMGIYAEPEGHYADDKRADIMVLFKKWNLPIEIKRDDHDQLWKAPVNQLIGQYVRAPATERFGIYLVFWYGEHGKGLQGPPQGSGISKPSTCQELKDSLGKTIPSEYRSSVIVMVLDVSTRKPVEKT